MLVEEGVYIPALPCMQAAVMIHRILWWKKGVLSLRCGSLLYL
jgi:predicted cobalt transporter CbtA